MERDVARILITRDRVDARIRELGAEIAAGYADPRAGITIVSVLSGAIIFLADLIRHMPMKMKIGLITVSSYAGATTESRGASLTKDLDVDIRGRHVLIVDDILDTGGTLRLVQKRLRAREPRSLRTAVLLRKRGKAPPDVTVDYVGFDIDDLFVVGYGLDYNDHYRNFPHIAVLRPEVYAEE